MYKVLYISNEAALGGAAQSLVNMLKIVQKRGVKPVVILPGQGVLEECLKELKIRYFVISFTLGYGKIGTGSRQKADANFVDNYKAALQLQEIIRAERIDLVHINSSVSNVGAFAALMAGIPYVWHLRELLENHFGLEFLDKSLKNKLFQQAAVTIAISDIVKETYADKYDISPIRIYNGVDADRYKRELSALPGKETEQRFIITGAITENKGQYEAIRAVEILVQEGIKNIHLTLIGSVNESFGWFLNQYILKHRLKSYVTILPFQKELAKYREKCSYALTTSKMEALGRCTIEAMLAGNLVIGADTGGTKEIIGEDKTRGYLYQQGDVRSLADTMKRAMAEAPKIKEQCRRNAQVYAEETFSLERYGDKILSLYKEILEEQENSVKQDRKVQAEELAVRYECLKEVSQKEAVKESCYKTILKEWMCLTEQGKSISDILKKENIYTVAIYGMGNLGCRVYDELVAGGIAVPYVIDRNPKFLEEIVPVKAPEDAPEGVDAVIVAVSAEEKKIVTHYREKYGVCVMGVSEILQKERTIQSGWKIK